VTSRFRKEEIVARSIPASVEAFVRDRIARDADVEPLAGDASTRRYFRVTSAGKTWVLSHYPEPFEVGELSFCVVRALLARHGLPVPEIHDHDGSHGLLLLQDLGDQTLQIALETAGPSLTEDYYREAIDQLVRLQGAAVRGAEPCFTIAFDIEKLTWELHYFEKHFLEGLRERDLSVEDRAVLAEGFHGLAEEIASWPRVLTHRDYHSRNLMPHRGLLYWIDFQDARMGPAQYDLASLLRDSYIGLDEDFIAARAEEFRQKAVPGESRETFLRRFELMSVQRNLKALGTFGFMATQRNNKVYLPYVPATLASARRNLLRHPELSGLNRVLARHVEELR
jgi:N-acetylmuramate 1-kinase